MWEEVGYIRRGEEQGDVGGISQIKRDDPVCQVETRFGDRAAKEALAGGQMNYGDSSVTVAMSLGCVRRQPFVTEEVASKLARRCT